MVQHRLHQTTFGTKRTPQTHSAIDDVLAAPHQPRVLGEDVHDERDERQRREREQHERQQEGEQHRREAALAHVAAAQPAQGARFVLLLCAPSDSRNKDGS